MLYDPNALIVPTDTIDVEPAPTYVEPIRYMQRHSEHFWHSFHLFFIWHGGNFCRRKLFKLTILFLHELPTLAGSFQCEQSCTVATDKLICWPNIFRFCPFNGQKRQEKVSKSQNADKNGLGEYVTIIFRHFLLIYIPFWRRGDFLNTFRSSRSVCAV